MANYREVNRAIRAEFPSRDIEVVNPRYISATDAAKMIRKDLKAKFPGTKFSVRKTSGSCAITVSYDDTAVAVDAVKDVVAPYEGGGFDGMIDMAYSKTAYIAADGTVGVAYSDGTEGSMGVVPGFKKELPLGAELVRFANNYVFVCTATREA